MEKFYILIVYLILLFLLLDLPSLRTLVIGNQRNLNSSNFLKAKQLIISGILSFAFLQQIYLLLRLFILVLIHSMNQNIYQSQVNLSIFFSFILDLPNLTSITFFHHSLGNMNCTAVVELNSILFFLFFLIRLTSSYYNLWFFAQFRFCCQLNTPFFTTITEISLKRRHLLIFFNNY